MNCYASAFTTQIKTTAPIISTIFLFSFPRFYSRIGIKCVKSIIFCKKNVGLICVAEAASREHLDLFSSSELSQTLLYC